VADGLPDILTASLNTEDDAAFPSVDQISDLHSHLCRCRSFDNPPPPPSVLVASSLRGNGGNRECKLHSNRRAANYSGNKILFYTYYNYNLYYTYYQFNSPHMLDDTERVHHHWTSDSAHVTEPPK
jgi:hypothetical protein